MKLVLKEEALDVGDRITFSVTHHIRVNGEDSWVKYEASSHRRPGETTDQTDTRLLNHVDGTAIRACEQVASTVEAHQ